MTERLKRKGSTRDPRVLESLFTARRRPARPVRDVPSVADFPERALWAAALADAVDIYVGQTVAPVREQTAAERWIEDPHRGVGSFSWCCHLLGLDEGAVRERVSRARRHAPRGRGRTWRAGPAPTSSPGARQRHSFRHRHAKHA
jgi:hypothetical protein